MRNRIFQSAITGIFLLLVLLPLAQQITGIIPQPRLQEKRRLAPLPSLTVGSLISGEFQRQFNMYMNDNYGLRSWLVRINNQIDITIFKVTH